MLQRKLSNTSQRIPPGLTGVEQSLDQVWGDYTDLPVNSFISQFQDVTVKQMKSFCKYWQ